MAVPGAGNVQSKKREKQEKYQDFARKIIRLWTAKAKLVPVVVEAPGLVPKNLNKHLKDIGILNRYRILKKSAPLGTATKLGKVLEV